MPATKKRTQIRDLQPGQTVEDEVFRLVQKDLRTTTNGGLYIHAVLADSTGELLARMWNASQAVFDAMPEGGFLYLRGRVENFKAHGNSSSTACGPFRRARLIRRIFCRRRRTKWGRCGRGWWRSSAA
ncbi:MAG: hypothetical protein IPM64_05750 [Phycisphaerales bacterium]|nr:hypothetical protein [Phycisphaerales bacterium]